MNVHYSEGGPFSRRRVLKDSAALLVSGAAGGTVGAHSTAAAGQVPAQKAMNWNQQGHMDCVMCHGDHTEATAK
jgi:anaerobic selenocysteine-containing dehydrogenase